MAIGSGPIVPRYHQIVTTSRIRYPQLRKTNLPSLRLVWTLMVFRLE
jgi:hypothetical protein